MKIQIRKLYNNTSHSNKTILYVIKLSKILIATLLITPIIKQKLKKSDNMCALTNVPIFVQEIDVIQDMA